MAPIVRSFTSTSHVVQTITDILICGKETGHPIVLVINGWDGLSTNLVALVSLFEPCIHSVQMTMRIFAVKLRVFHKVAVIDAVKCFNGEFEGDTVLPYNIKNSNHDCSKPPSSTSVQPILFLSRSLNRAETRLTQAHGSRTGTGLLTSRQHHDNRIMMIIWHIPRAN